MLPSNKCMCKIASKNVINHSDSSEVELKLVSPGGLQPTQCTQHLCFGSAPDDPSRVSENTLSLLRPEAPEQSMTTYD